MFPKNTPFCKAATLLAGFAALLVSNAGCSSSPEATPESTDLPPPPAASYQHGVNISHYLSQVAENRFADPSRFSREDMAWIADRGYDHIRLPIDGPNFLNGDGSVREERLAEIDKVLRWARQEGICVILDMHQLPGTAFAGDLDASLFTNPELQRVALDLWRVLADRFQGIGPELRFEILNEPVAEDASLVTAFYARALEVIRAVSPDRVVLVCSNRWGRFETVDALSPLLDDPNVVVAVHYYDPHIFTHQGASWVGWTRSDFPRIHFPGIVPDISEYARDDFYGQGQIGDKLTIARVEEEFATLVQWAREKNVELHLGEFGVYKTADEESMRTWYHTVLDQCRTYGIGWAVWDYKGGFAVRDYETGQPTLVQEVIDDYLP